MADTSLPRERLLVPPHNPLIEPDEVVMTLCQTASVIQFLLCQAEDDTDWNPSIYSNIHAGRTLVLQMVHEAVKFAQQQAEKHRFERSMEKRGVAL